MSFTWGLFLLAGCAIGMRCLWFRLFQARIGHKKPPRSVEELKLRVWHPEDLRKCDSHRRVNEALPPLHCSRFCVCLIVRHVAERRKVSLDGILRRLLGCEGGVRQRGRFLHDRGWSMGQVGMEDRFRLGEEPARDVRSHGGTKLRSKRHLGVRRCHKEAPRFSRYDIPRHTWGSPHRLWVGERDGHGAVQVGQLFLCHRHMRIPVTTRVL